MLKKWWLVMVLILVIGSFQGVQAESPVNENTKVINIVMEYVKQKQEDDILVEVEPQVWVKSSNIYGIEIDGIRYYYSLFPHMSYDPIGTGKWKVQDVKIIASFDEWPVTIYRKKIVNDTLVEL